METPAGAGLSRRSRIWSVVSGIFLFVVFFSLDQSASTLEISFFAPWDRISPGEFNFWLGSFMLLVPASLLIGYGLSGGISLGLERLKHSLLASKKEDQWKLLLSLFLCVLAAARVAQSLVLYDFPITDDEYAVRFGGELLASGVVKVQPQTALEMLPSLFLYQAPDGGITSMDWLGGQLAVAFGVVTGLDAFVHPFFAALPIPLVGWLVGRKLGREWGALAVFLALFSPAVVTMSLTNHSQLLSRAFVLLAIAIYAVAQDTPSFKRWFGFGLVVGAAGLCRPFESGALLLPFAVLILLDCAREQSNKRPILPILIGLLIPLALFLIHNALVSGDPFLPARFSGEVIGGSPSHGLLPTSFDILKARMGSNLGYNLLMLTVWVLGPVGLVLIAAGAGANRITKAISAGVALNLLVALFHDDYGIHMVGPIHYSEASMLLIVVAAFGAHRLHGWAKAHQIELKRIIPAFVATIALTLGTFIIWHMLALNEQAKIHRDIYAFVDDPELPKCVILAPQYGSLWFSNQELRRNGSFVFGWRRVSPDASENAIILRADRADLERIERDFPNREVFWLGMTAEGTLALSSSPPI